MFAMFDALTARAIAAEVSEKIVPGRVQAVLSLDDLTIGLEIYAHQARHYLLASADPTKSRVHLVSDKLRASGAPPASFVLLLKKYADGALVNRVEAVTPERILRLEIDHAEYGVTTLIAEIMGRLSNLILVDAAGVVLEAIKRVTPAMSRARTIQPKTPYLPPPPQAKVDPLLLSSERLARILAEASDEPLWQVLVRSVAGTSPLLARELAFRAAGRVDAESEAALGASVHAELAKVWRAPAEPALAYEAGRPTAVAAFALKHLRQTESLDSMSAALEKFFGVVEPYQAVKEPLRRELEAASARLERKREALRRELVSPAQVERSKISGELILAHAANIAPGQKSLRAEMVEGQSIQIKLDPNLTPVENAQAYFSEYRRAKDAAAAVPALLDGVEADLAFADQVLVDLETAETRDEIDVVIAEAREAGLVVTARRRIGQAVATQPRVYISPDGFQVLVGRNARQNELITFDRAGAEDLWLHARGFAGAHVVILANGREVPETTLEFAASLAAFYSKARVERWVDVAVARRKNVRRVSGRAARPGLVTVRDERTIRVRPGEPNQSIGDDLK
jgi:predicted ribosome quality control (RQC) complex YloA/Tae2 family protein